MLRLEPIQKHSEQKKNRPLQEEVSDFFIYQIMVASCWLPAPGSQIINYLFNANATFTAQAM
jgi:hypothetical protein